MENLYPCPFNPDRGDLTIVYSLDRDAADVSMCIYSKAFRLVRKISLSGRSAGINQSRISGADLKELANDYYLYYMEINDPTGTGRGRIKELLIIR